MSTPLVGNIETLASRKCAVWDGWVMYSWDMGFVCHLFDEKPDREDEFGWSFDGAKPVDPEVLRECGVDVEYDVEDEAGHEFYYGKGSDEHGNHDPQPICLRLPPGLLSSLVGNLH